MQTAQWKARSLGSELVTFLHWGSNSSCTSVSPYTKTSLCSIKPMQLIPAIVNTKVLSVRHVGDNNTSTLLFPSILSIESTATTTVLMTDVFHGTHWGWESMMINARMPDRSRPDAMWYQHVTYCKCLWAALSADANPRGTFKCQSIAPQSKVVETAQAHILSAVSMLSCSATHRRRMLHRPLLFTQRAKTGSDTMLV